MNILKRLDHPNLVKLLDIVIERDANLTTSTYFVFEYCEHDLEGMLMSNIRFNLPQIKRIIHSILTGLSELHKKNIIHRDIKTDNILYNKNKDIKVADFGLSKDLNIKRAPLSRKLQHMLYRAPESLFGSQHYSFKVDVWSAGIIFYQLLFRNQENCPYKILFPANNDEQLKQAKNYFYLLGNPELEHIWNTNSKNELKMKEFEQLMSQFTPEEKANFKNRFSEHIKGMNPNIDEGALNLLIKMLALDPSQRFSAEECLQHPFFSSEPFMADNIEMPSIDDGQEYHQMTQSKIFITERQKLIEQQQQQQLLAAAVTQNGIALPPNGLIQPNNQAGSIPTNQQNQAKRNKAQNIPNNNNNNQRNGQPKMVMNGQGNQIYPQNAGRFNNSQQQGKSPNMQQRYQQQQQQQNSGPNGQLQQQQQQKQPYANQNSQMNKQNQQNFVGNNFNKTQKRPNGNNQNNNIQNNNQQQANINQYNGIPYKSNNNNSNNNNSITPNVSNFSYTNSQIDSNLNANINNSNINNTNNPNQQNIFFMKQQQQLQTQQQQQGVNSVNNETAANSQKLQLQMQSSLKQSKYPNSNFYKHGNSQLPNQEGYQTNATPGINNNNNNNSTLVPNAGLGDKTSQLEFSCQEDFQQNCNNYSESTEVSNQENMNNFRQIQFCNMNTSVKEEIGFSMNQQQNNSNSFSNLPNDSSGRNSGSKKYQDQCNNINLKRKLSIHEGSTTASSSQQQQSVSAAAKSQNDQLQFGEIRKKQKQNMVVNTNFHMISDYSPSQLPMQSNKNLTNIQNNVLENIATTPTHPTTIQQAISPVLSATRPYAPSFDLLQGSSYIKGMESQQQIQQLNQLKNSSTSQASGIPTGLQILQQIAQDGTQLRRSNSLTQQNSSNSQKLLNNNNNNNTIVNSGFALSGNSSLQLTSSIPESDAGGVSSSKLQHSLPSTNEKQFNLKELSEKTQPQTPDFTQQLQEENSFSQYGRQQQQSYYGADKQHFESGAAAPSYQKQSGASQNLSKKQQKQLKREEKKLNKNKQLLNHYSQTQPFQVESAEIQPNLSYQASDYILEQQVQQSNIYPQVTSTIQQSLNYSTQAAPQQLEQIRIQQMDVELPTPLVEQKLSSSSSTAAPSHSQNIEKEDLNNPLKCSQATEQLQMMEPVINMEKDNQMSDYQDTSSYNIRSSFGRKTSDHFSGQEFMENYGFVRQPSFSMRLSYPGMLQSPFHHVVDTRFDCLSPNHPFEIKYPYNEMIPQHHPQFDMGSPCFHPSNFPLNLISNHTQGEGAQN